MASEKKCIGEMIGKNIIIIEAKNSSLLGLQGKVIDESKNTMKIITSGTSNKTKTVLKETIKFKIIN